VPQSYYKYSTSAARDEVPTTTFKLNSQGIVFSFGCLLSLVTATATIAFGRCICRSLLLAIALATRVHALAAYVTAA
jgi:hypothetical protein